MVKQVYEHARQHGDGEAKAAALNFATKTAPPKPTATEVQPVSPPPHVLSPLSALIFISTGTSNTADGWTSQLECHPRKHSGQMSVFSERIHVPQFLKRTSSNLCTGRLGFVVFFQNTQISQSLASPNNATRTCSYPHTNKCQLRI